MSNKEPKWYIRLAAADDRDEVVAFVDTARRQIFPLLAHSPLPKDLANFNATYIDGPGQFLLARSAIGELIASIGYLPYDHRFPQLDYKDRRTVEVVRLFVVPEDRRSGLASDIFDALRQHALRDHVECLYLHTHPFLPGAISFWQRQGFRIVDVEADPDWQTTHMDLSL